MSEQARNSKLKLASQDLGKRLDIFLSEQLGQSRSAIQRMIKGGDVFVNGKLPKKPGDVLRTGSKIEIKEKIKIENKIKTEDIDTPQAVILAETPEYLIVHKPAGLLVHETQAHEQGTLAKQLVKTYPKIRHVDDAEARAGIVHRLDKEASGLIVVARTQKMFDSLKKQFQSREIEKEYLVLAHGAFESDHGTINFAIDRGTEGRMVSRPKSDMLSLRGVTHAQPGKEAITEFWVEKRFTRYTLLLVRIHTGRTHQIRAHLLAYNHPVVGDMLYFNKKLNRKRDLALGRLFLHATRLCFTDLEKAKQCYEDPLPKELQEFLVHLK